MFRVSPTVAAVMDGWNTLHVVSYFQMVHPMITNTAIAMIRYKGFFQNGVAARTGGLRKLGRGSAAGRLGSDPILPNGFVDFTADEFRSATYALEVKDRLAVSMVAPMGRLSDGIVGA